VQDRKKNDQLCDQFCCSISTQDFHKWYSYVFIGIASLQFCNQDLSFRTGDSTSRAAWLQVSKLLGVSAVYQYILALLKTQKTTNSKFELLVFA
jgi:hypothetical protein